jgi:CxxC motif-containing protein
LKQLTCIVCPNSCRISTEIVDGQYVFTGNKCPRGADFAKTELTAPTRSVTTTVRTSFDFMPALPVKTKGEISKALIPAIIRALADIVVTREIGFGGVIVENILGTGVDVIACDSVALKDMSKSEAGKEYSHA